MKQIISIASLLLMSLTALGQGPQVTISKDLDSTPGMDPVFIREIKLWKSLQTEQVGAFKSNLSPDLVVNLGAIQENRDQFVDGFKHCTIGPLNLQNHKTQTASTDTVTISYKLHLQMTCGKHDASMDENITTTWVRVKNDKWLVQHLVGTPVQAPS